MLTGHLPEEPKEIQESVYNSFKRLIPSNFIQDNVSFNKRKYTFRGLHFQLSPFEQGKLVRVETGEIVDFVIDLRKFSKTYLKMIKVKLSETQNL